MTCLYGLRGNCGFLKKKRGKWPRESTERMKEVEGLHENCGQKGKRDYK